MSSSKVHLYTHPISQPGRSVTILLTSADIPWEFHMVDLMKGEHKTAEFLKINPRGKVPAILDGKFLLSEGAAILVYLATKYEKRQWYPTDVEAQARVNEWLHWNHLGLRRLTSGGLMAPIVVHGVDPATLGDAVAAAESVLVEVDAALAKSKFLAGDQPTIADLFVVPEIDQLAILGLVKLEKYANITRWLSDLSAEASGYAPNVEQVKGIVTAFLAQKAAATAE
jgi:glutathione S-transferase